MSSDPFFFSREGRPLNGYLSYPFSTQINPVGRMVVTAYPKGVRLDDGPILRKEVNAYVEGN